MPARGGGKGGGGKGGGARRGGGKGVTIKGGKGKDKFITKVKNIYKGGGGGGGFGPGGETATGDQYAGPDTGTTSMLRSQGKAYAAGRAGIGNYRYGEDTGGGLTSGGTSGAGGAGGGGGGKGPRKHRPRRRTKTTIIVKGGRQRGGPGKRAQGRPGSNRTTGRSRGGRKGK